MAQSAAGTLLLAACWVGALISAVAVILLHTSTLAALRDELEALGEPPAPGPAHPGGARMFGALYQREPTLVDRVRGRPVPLIAGVAVLLATLSGWLVLQDAEQTRELALGQRAVIGQVRAAHDSLSAVVAALRDSLRAVRADPAPARHAPVASARSAPGSLARTAGPAAPITSATSGPGSVTRADRPAKIGPDLPPPPSFEAMSPNSR